MLRGLCFVHCSKYYFVVLFVAFIVIFSLSLSRETMFNLQEASKISIETWREGREYRKNYNWIGKGVYSGTQTYRTSFSKWRENFLFIILCLMVCITTTCWTNVLKFIVNDMTSRGWERMMVCAASQHTAAVRQSATPSVKSECCLNQPTTNSQEIVHN